jgi:AraC-like DNA-binding protein
MQMETLRLHFTFSFLIRIGHGFFFFPLHGSRAAFARNFSASVGEPPHSYLTRWRMGIAARLLEETDLRLSEIASRVGYRSEFSFSRAFKLARGVSPIQYRRENA